MQGQGECIHAARFGRSNGLEFEFSVALRPRPLPVDFGCFVQGQGECIHAARFGSNDLEFEFNVALRPQPRPLRAIGTASLLSHSS